MQTLSPSPPSLPAYGVVAWPWGLGVPESSRGPEGEMETCRDYKYKAQSQSQKAIFHR
ncbi:hypothetical protein PUN28_000678 [Cardiocondyla obscurior]|uniref:Uncharacterized protein n=1 Tax=Cardiocondyla obscurior TaxID=286306 RepID=A0AAW2H0K6_9HYME